MKTKILLSFLFLTFVITGICGQDYFMYIDGKRYDYKASSDKMLIQFNKEVDFSEVKNTFEKTLMIKATDVIRLDDELALVNMHGTSVEKRNDLIAQFGEKEEIAYTSPVLECEDGFEVGIISDQLLVRLKKPDDYPVLLKKLKLYDIKGIEPYGFDESLYLISVNKSSKRNSMQIANELYESGLFDCAEPNLYHFVERLTNDPYFSSQWALKNTGQSGGTAEIDIKATEAWGITSGSPGIKVAVFDSGVDLTHPDLQENLLQGYNASTGANSGDIDDYNDVPKFVAHGTACAGIIAAIADNGKGIAGVAYDCKMLPIYHGLRTNSMVAGINWARLNGADVISMSTKYAQSPLLDVALSTAATAGRNGLGCVIVAASDNVGTSTVTYPASHPNVIAVGAIDRNGLRASFSCFGNDLDVVAPGVGIYTTDPQGNIGNNTSSGAAGNYFSNFEGTSAACPQVAGIAALILSARPDLRADQVRYVIESTCTKVNTGSTPGKYFYYNHSSHPNGTWYNEVGHGLVNAYKAVYSVAPRISGPDQICDQATYTINNLPAGATITWGCIGLDGFNRVLFLVSGQGTPTAVFRKNFTGNHTIYADITVGEVTFRAEKNNITTGTPSIPSSWMDNITPSYSTLGYVTYPVCFSSLTPNTSYYIQFDDQGYSSMPYLGYDVENVSGTSVHIVKGLNCLKITPTMLGTKVIRVRAHNACGESDPLQITINVQDCLPGPPGPGTDPITLSCYPNPADDVLNVSIEEETQSLSSSRSLADKPVYTIRLWSGVRGLVRTVEAQQGAVTQISLQGLPSGLYFVHIIKDGEILRKQIIQKR